jgi:hypothetical protein
VQKGIARLIVEDETLFFTRLRFLNVNYTRNKEARLAQQFAKSHV